MLAFGNALYLITQVTLASANFSDLEAVDSCDEGDRFACLYLNFGSMYYSFLSLFNTMMGNIDFNAVTGHTEINDAIPSFVYFFYIVLNSLILLNMLIALMTDTLDQIQVNSAGNFSIERAKLILGIEEILNGFFTFDAMKERGWVPKWLHILFDANESNRNTNWEGHVKAISNAMETHFTNASDQMSKQLLSVMNFQSDRMGKIEEKMDQIQKTLTKFQKSMHTGLKVSSSSISMDHGDSETIPPPPSHAKQSPPFSPVSMSSHRRSSVRKSMSLGSLKNKTIQRR